jgi:hypothetical protein
MRWLKRIAVALACVLSSAAFADEPWDLAVEMSDDPAFLGHPPVLPVNEAQLDQLRGRWPAPMNLQQVGVVLWDEPRKPLPPQRTSGVDSPSVFNSSGGGTSSVSATISRN